MKTTVGKNTTTKLSSFKSFPPFISTVLLDDVSTNDLVDETGLLDDVITTDIIGETGLLDEVITNDLVGVTGLLVSTLSIPVVTL